MTTSKPCTKCDRTKPLDEFPRRCGVALGRTSWCRQCRNADRLDRHRKQYVRDPEKTRASNRRRNRQRKQKIIDIYGGRCECCHVTDIEFLCVDHVNGDGALERRTLKGAGVYQKLVKAGVRLPGYRLLCLNCNFSKFAFQ